MRFESISTGVRARATAPRCASRCWCGTVELAAFVAVGFGSGQREFRHLHVAVEHLNFGVFAEITDEGDFVEAAHGRKVAARPYFRLHALFPFRPPPARHRLRAARHAHHRTVPAAPGTQRPPEYYADKTLRYQDYTYAPDVRSVQ